jgi:phage protein D
MSTVIPLYAETQTFFGPAFELKVRDAPVPRNVVRDVIEVTYEDHIDKIDSFSLVINGWDADLREPKYFGASTEPAKGSEAYKLAYLFRPFTGVQLLMGYQGTTPDLRKMIDGRITSVDLELGETAPRIVVRGLNILDRFRTRQYTWSWPENGTGTIRDSDIATLLMKAPDDKAGRPGLDFPVRTDPQAPKRETAHDHVFMNNKYPIVFLMERARRLGYSLFVDMDPVTGEAFLYFGPSERLRDRAYELEWGRSLVSLKVNVGTARQVKKVTVLGWDRKTKKPIKGEATFETLQKRGVFVNQNLRALAEESGREEIVTEPPVYTQHDANQRAANLLSEQREELVTVTGVTVGLPDLRAGRRVRLNKVDFRLDGWYFVTATSHVINDSGYRTTFQARRVESEGGQG